MTPTSLNDSLVVWWVTRGRENYTNKSLRFVGGCTSIGLHTITVMAGSP